MHYMIGNRVATIAHDSHRQFCTHTLTEEHAGALIATTPRDTCHGATNTQYTAPLNPEKFRKSSPGMEAGLITLTPILLKISKDHTMNGVLKKKKHDPPHVHTVG